MKAHTQKTFLVSLLGLLLLFPVLGAHSVSAAASADTQANKTGIVYECGPVAGDCDFNDLIAAVQKVINWAIKFGLGFSVVVIAYAGWIYLQSGGSSGERDKANKMFVSVGKGIFFMLAAWLIVNLIMTKLAPGVSNIIKN